MNTVTEIIVDHREAQSGVWEHLSKLPDVRLHWENLRTGDYVVERSVVFERKTAADFADSIIDERLFLQAKRLTGLSLRSALILEGDAAAWKALSLRREALQGALITLTLIFNLPVFRSETPKETAQLLVYAGTQLARLRSEISRYHNGKPKRKRTRQLRLLTTFPGIGPDRAHRLLEHFGSIQACINASAETLETIPGIGPKTAAAIRELVTSSDHPTPSENLDPTIVVQPECSGAAGAFWS
jgi:DNA excision repair protein ERCC-4